MGRVRIVAVLAAAALIVAACDSSTSRVTRPPRTRRPSTTTVPTRSTTTPTLAPTTATTAGPGRSARPADTTGPLPVQRVVDGDTVVVAPATTLRLIGMDTPETVDPRTPVQCFGREASARAHALLDGTSVWLEFDGSQGRLDKYGRTLAYVWMADGRLFEQVMIADGYAHEYTYALPYRYQDAFIAAERAARTASRGLWSPTTCNGDTTTAATPAATVPSAPQAPGGGAACDPSYPTVCIPPPPPDLDCADVLPARAFTVVGADPHRFDSDHDGIGCEG
jgi:micrococcal nuclease